MIGGWHRGGVVPAAPGRAWHHARVQRRSWWGWGAEGEGLTDVELDHLAGLLGEPFGLDGRRRQAPDPADLDLRAPRVAVPRSLADLASDEPGDRAGHSMGKSYRDVVRGLRGQVDHPPDAVLRPATEAELAAVLDWCANTGVAVVPYGGGSSVVGGVEPDVGDAYRGVVSVDLGRFDRVLEVDEVSLSARVQAGVLGPALESQLRPHGVTLRHFPQSFEWSTLGGWVATRAGGHFATGPTHIDDLVQAVRMLTPSGPLETRRLPGSGAGPSPDRLLLGSEGVLGIVTEAWVRVRRRPRWRAGGACRFATFEAGAHAVRALAQSGLMPSNCRLVDPVESLVNGIGDGNDAVLLVGFESADHPVDPWAARAAELVADHGGRLDGTWAGRSDERAGADAGQRTAADGASGAEPTADAGTGWRRAFIRAPYVRDALVRLGVLCETLETAVTWDRWPALHQAVTGAIRAALAEVGASAGMVTCRFTHAYPDGPAPYYTVIAPAREGMELEQWAVVKAAASDAILNAGGTITHHHAVGRDHRHWYDRQRPDLFAAALVSAKAALDPAGVLNPGVLVDPGVAAGRWRPPGGDGHR